MSDTPTPYIKRDVAGSTGYECRECGQMYGDWFDRDCDHDYPSMSIDEYVVPDSLQEERIWFLWDMEMKQPLAPWVNGHMFPTKWGEGVMDDPDYDPDERPEGTYEQARFVSEMSPGEIEEVYSPTVNEWKGMDAQYSPNEIETPDSIRPTIMLLPDDYRSPDPGVIFVDFDDVRDPGSGWVTPEVADLVERLDAYTEVSRSGTGLHCFLRGSLPDGVTQVQKDLDEGGHIEIYDHGRFVGNTWHHVEGTPVEVPRDTGVVAEIVDEYAENDSLGAGWSGDSSTGSSDWNPDEVNAYYSGLDVCYVADRDRFAEHRHQAPGDDWQGPHPVHGAQSGQEWDSESGNFGVQPDRNQWYCHWHGFGGTALHLIPILEGWVGCTDSTPESMSQVFNLDSHMVLKSCLKARDDYDPDDELEGEEPPKAALRAVADIHDLPMDDPDEGILGSLTHKTAVTIYGEMEAGDVPLDDN